MLAGVGFDSSVTLTASSGTGYMYITDTAPLDGWLLQRAVTTVVVSPLCAAVASTRPESHCQSLPSFVQSYRMKTCYQSSVAGRSLK